MADNPQPLQFGPLSRRGFLTMCGLGWITGHALGASADETLQAAIPVRVRERETLRDAVTLFRAGASERIDEAMAQFGQVTAEFSAAPPPRLFALRWALLQYLSPAASAGYSRWQRGQHVPGSVTSFGQGDYKCNKLVADAYAIGADAGLSIGTDWFGEGRGTGWPALQQGADVWPPQANHLADPAKNLRSLTNARALRQPGEEKAKPELGDIIAFPGNAESGHVGLYLGRNLIVSAKETGIEIGPLEVEQLEHGNIVRIRKFNGSGR